MRFLNQRLCAYLVRSLKHRIDQRRSVEIDKDKVGARKAASKQFSEVKNMTGRQPGKDSLLFNTREFGLVERMEKEQGKERKVLMTEVTS